MKTYKLKKPYQSSFTIKTDCNKTVETLFLKYGCYIIESEERTDFILKLTKHQQGYEFVSTNETVITEYPLAVIDRFIYENNKYDDSVFALHGAAVEYSNRAYLFLAPTTGGKTTLAAYLSSLGFGYITDDCILLNRENFYVSPVNTPIHLRGGGVSVLERYNAKPERLLILYDTPAVRHVFTPKNCIEFEIPLEKIFFINRTSDQNNLIPMSGNERISELMKSPITQYEVNSDYIRFLTRLAKSDCFKLNYCDMNYVSEVIRNG